MLGGIARYLLDQPVGVSRGAKGEGHTCCETKDKHRSYAVVFHSRCSDGLPLPPKSELPAITAFEAAGSGSHIRTRSFETESIDGFKFILERRGL